MCMEKNKLTVELKKLEMEDLIFENIPFQDRINTELELKDYDWMNYTLTTSFITQSQGQLNVRFEYFGATFSQMDVEQLNEEICKEYRYTYSSDIFQKYLVQFMMCHLKQWENEEVFYGGELMLAFYNEVLETGCLEEVKEVCP